MKITLKQLKQIIKEEVGRFPSGGTFGNVDSIVAACESEVTALAQCLAERIANSMNPGGAETVEVDALLPEVENALKDAVESLVSEFV